ncbi:resistance to inhibitors of cholinesterase protein 3 isoform X5 [Aphidius gifuensis]|uniref:resistance to inhibitors of cholinesterase protein 3 isoform X5 n=1 Tax=Aphidius gifuensis TaxID=684658 RepID=UPI001CDCA100|nr:resistance to inhibitors of cholinesterase protein 3 isoform X5 [Aphidius gifuensis]
MERTRINERLSYDNEKNKLPPESEFGIKKTILVLAVVAGCFAILWPKIFYPMIIGPSSYTSTDKSAPIRQERKAPIHAGNSHPAMRERGRAIPASHIVPKVDGRPDHVVPKMRPPMGGGGGGRVIMSSQGGGGGGGSSMGIIMPLYTVGILVFFLYTMAKVLRKNSKNEIHQDYRNIEAEREFRNRVFNPAALASAITGAPYPKKEKTPVPAKPIKTIEELKSLVDVAPKSICLPGIVVIPLKIDCNDENCCQMQQNDNEKCELPCGIKMSGIKTTAYSKSERKISRPTTPVIPQSKKDDTEREQTSTNEVFLEGTIPPNCDLFVLDTETQEEENSQCGIILSSKVTLSLIDHNDNLFIKGEKNGDIYVKKKKNKPEFENGKNKKVDEEDEEDEDDDEEFITAKQDKSRDEIEEDEEDADLRTENNPFTLSDHHYEMKKKFDDEQNDIDSDEISNEIEDDDDQLDNDNLIVNMKEENKFKSMKIENIERNKNKKIEEVEDDASEDEESPKNKR